MRPLMSIVLLALCQLLDAELHTRYPDRTWNASPQPERQLSAARLPPLKDVRAPEAPEDEGPDAEDESAAVPKPPPVVVQAPLPARDVLPKAEHVGGTNPIVIKGNFLYDSVTGKRFFSKGVA
mmetsp:Transcript_134082/g.428421  ORF Transcript_134082/g.428421 Transcript_134082/m.428421 type:complete len:123 (+) Transcript_134082:2-370(+)